MNEQLTIDQHREAIRQRLTILEHQMRRLLKIAGKLETRQDRGSFPKKLRIAMVFLRLSLEHLRVSTTPIPKFKPGAAFTHTMIIDEEGAEIAGRLRNFNQRKP